MMSFVVAALSRVKTPLHLLAGFLTNRVTSGPRCFPGMLLAG